MVGQLGKARFELLRAVSVETGHLLLYPSVLGACIAYVHGWIYRCTLLIVFNVLAFLFSRVATWLLPRCVALKRARV
mgnify:CR=1 FL=1